MLDENRYPTLRMLRCRACGNVFVAGLTGSEECPDCSSADTHQYRPGDQGTEGSDRDDAAGQAGPGTRDS